MDLPAKFGDPSLMGTGKYKINKTNFWRKVLNLLKLLLLSLSLLILI